jgi:hypothetical protein
MAGKKKGAVRRRRKQAARAQVKTTPEMVEKVVAVPAASARPSWTRFFSRRKGSRPAAPEKEPWSKAQITVLVLLAVVIQTVLSPFVVPAKSWLDSALVFVGPQMLLGAGFAQPIARRLLHVRALGFLETMTVGATLSLLAFFAQYALVVPLLSPNSTPGTGAGATATASPAASPSHTAAASPSPAVTASLAPKAGPVSEAASRPCPLDHPNCTYAPPAYEVETAEAMADAVGIVLTIFLYQKIHRFFWMPRRRAQMREERRRKVKSK